MINKRLLITLVVFLFLTLGTFLAIFWAKGYRPSLKEKSIKGTGLLVANSYPEGASVYLNDKLTTATDDTLHLPPGEYRIKIVKDGFIPWEKTLKLESELVSQTNARLFPSVPDLTALTLTEAIDPTPSPNGQKIAYKVASASARQKNGLWVLHLSDSPIKIGTNNIQVAQSTSGINFTKANLVWSPNSQQILVSTVSGNHFLLDSQSLNKADGIKDVTARLPIILDEWQQEIAIGQQKRLEKLPKFMQKIATTSAQNVYFSPDETKIVYQATQDFTIPQNLLPPLPATNTQKEARDIKKEQIYVYDLKEDKNFLIKTVADSEELINQKTTNSKANKSVQNILNNIQKNYSALYSPIPQWLPTSQHLIFTEKNDQQSKGKINIIEYDGTNLETIFVGSFENDFVYPWPSGNKLIILTSLGAPMPNLYAINLR